MSELMEIYEDMTVQEIYDILISIMNKYEYDEEILEDNIKWLDILVERLQKGEKL